MDPATPPAVETSMASSTSSTLSTGYSAPKAPVAAAMPPLPTGAATQSSAASNMEPGLVAASSPVAMSPVTPISPVAPSVRQPKKGRRPQQLTLAVDSSSQQVGQGAFVASCERAAATRHSPEAAAEPSQLAKASSGSNSTASPQHPTAATSLGGRSLLQSTLASEGASTTASSGGECFEVGGVEDLELLGKLGSGSSGFVEKHRHVRTGRELALKVIQAKDVSEAQRKAILLELRTFAKCRCPHIVDFYGAFFHESSIHIALEYMDAGALSGLLDRARSRPPTTVGPVVPEKILANMIWQILDGLEYLHCEMRVVHRDIKPSNLLLSRAGVVKITDFGVSGELEDELGASGGQLKVTFVGTTYYMSPERVRGEPYKYDSDMWSLGVTLFECSSGRYAYAREDEGSMKQLSFWELMRRIVEQEAPRLPDDQIMFSRPLQDFVQQMLQKEPRNRPSAAMMKTHTWLEGSCPPSAAQRLELATWIAEVGGEAQDAAAAAAAACAEAERSADSAVARSSAAELPTSNRSRGNEATASAAVGPLDAVGSPAGGLSMAMSQSTRHGQNPFSRRA